MGDTSERVSADPSARAVRGAAPAAAPAVAGAIGNGAMGRLLGSAAGRDALRRAAGADPGRGRTLARQIIAMNAPAERELGPNDRPPSRLLFDAYAKVSYDVWKKGANPTGASAEAQANGPWAFIGGSVGRMFGASDPADPAAGPRMAQHTCAARLSWAFNHCGAVAMKIKSGVMFPNDPKVTYGGTSGDGENYIVGAPAMESYLTRKWGKPDVKLGAIDTTALDVDSGKDVAVEGDATALRNRLRPDQIAVFAGAHHVGVISQKLKTPDYIYYDPSVVPAVAWILP
jgi:hypothetical protein